MTIIAYERGSQRVFVDTLFTFGQNTKAGPFHGSKLFETGSGHRFTACGEWPMHRFMSNVDSVFDNQGDDIHHVCNPFWLPPDVTIVARPYGDKYENAVYVSVPHKGAFAMMQVEDVFLHYPAVAWGSGSDAFGFYYVEHGDVQTAFKLTCAHATGCGIEPDAPINELGFF